uniref:Uncharacterized protein n=1 Tax=Arundo donax TaxID=35708 RepID=A0A0A9EDL6_ARUDO
MHNLSNFTVKHSGHSGAAAAAGVITAAPPPVARPHPFCSTRRRPFPASSTRPIPSAPSRRLRPAPTTPSWTGTPATGSHHLRRCRSSLLLLRAAHLSSSRRSSCPRG